MYDDHSENSRFYFLIHWGRGLISDASGYVILVEIPLPSLTDVDYEGVFFRGW